jgi:hypothetical protein
MQLPNPEEFDYQDHVVGGDDCWLIQPKSMGVKWTLDNLMFRSIIIRKSDYHVVSRGFDKFFNLGENVEIDRLFVNGSFADRTKKLDYLEKKDGSLLIWSMHNEQLIHRTRDTTNAIPKKTGSEIIPLLQKHPKITSWLAQNSEYSLLTEWLTPNYVIIISEVNEPTVFLIGVIHNQTGKLFSYQQLMQLSEELDIPTVPIYQYSSIKECVQDVTAWQKKEGVVANLTLPNDQIVQLKIKSDWYLRLHKMMAGINNLGNVLEVFLGSPKFIISKDFFDYITLTLDFEIAKKAMTEIEQVTNAYSLFVKKCQQLQERLRFISQYPSRKEQAAAIRQEYKDWVMTLAFHLLDDKPIDDIIIKKSLQKILNIK